MAANGHDDARRGARNLLRNCLAAKPGQKLLVIGEEGDWAHYDGALAGIVVEEARAMGLDATTVLAPRTRTAADVPAPLAAAVAGADHTVFFARMADQLRFLGLEGAGSMTACYTLDEASLGSAFARVDHRLLQEVHDRLADRIAAAARYTIRCPDGTDLEAGMTFPDGAGALTDFRIRLFPAMIFPPVDSSRLSGRLALAHRMTSSSTNIYDDSVLTPRSTVIALVEDGTIVGFEGDGDEGDRIRRHFERVGRIAGGDPFAVNSWHTGINPLTHYDGDPDEDPERWSTAVFGSPRLTHFHACGSDPGDIAISLFDATVAFDDEVLWRDGRFAFLDRPEIRALAGDYPGCEAVWTACGDIGVPCRETPRRKAS